MWGAHTCTVLCPVLLDVETRAAQGVDPHIIMLSCPHTPSHLHTFSLIHTLPPHVLTSSHARRRVASGPPLHVCVPEGKVLEGNGTQGEAC